MATKKSGTPAAVRKYLEEIGRKGGKVTGKKGLAAMSPEDRKRIQQKGAKARRAAARKAAKKK